ncbi:MAG: OmpA family protein [Saonia sp.]
MKKIVLFIVLFSFVQNMIAQQELKRADNYFERAFYVDAIPLYETLLPKNKSSKLIKNLADSYYNTYDMKSAAKWYTYLIGNYGNKVGPDYVFKLNQSLKAIGEYEKANQALLDYYTEQDEQEMIAQLRSHITYLENVKAIGNRFKIENLNINTDKSEFGAIAIDSNLVFSAAKKDASSLGKLYRWNNQSYLDIYTVPVDQIQLGGSAITSFSQTINTKMHEGTFAISRDRKTIYFTRNNYLKGKKKTDSKKISNLKIYRAERIDNEWQNINELPFNGDDFSTEHPALDKDEKNLYFASDREGGLGSFDLYSVSINTDGSFGEPKNLGPEINTDKKEQFPFLDANNNLYFSSNGHEGFGLLDIFLAESKNGTFQKPDNIGLPVNSGYDDFSFTQLENEKKGFFSSNRPQGKGSDDIYAFTESKPLVIVDCKQSISGILVDETTKMPIPKGEITIYDSEDVLLFNITTAEDASFHLNVDCSTEYIIKGNKTGYTSNSKTIYTTRERNKVNDGSLALLSLEEIEKQLQLAQQKEEEERLRQQEKAKEMAERAKKEKIKSTIQKEGAIVKEKEKTIIKTKAINFDYSMWYLRRESRERLAKVIEIMKENPGITIEIGTHTDRRGNANYNKQLSQKRANAVKKYLVENGIAKNKIVAKGYGESKPVIVCETDTSCSEEDHELNRRCEFVIVKWE